MEDRANTLDEPANVDGDGSGFGTRATGGSGDDASGVEGRARRETKAGTRRRHAGYSEKALATRMAHLLSQR